MSKNNNLEQQDPIKEEKKVGAPPKISDKDLREIALKIKHKLKGQMLTYSLLEKHSGIGRNTWSRRMKEEISSLNAPFTRPIELKDAENVYFPQIDEMIELHNGDMKKIKNELYEYEQMYVKLYDENEKNKIALKKFSEQSEQMKVLQEQISFWKDKASIYEKLYKDAVIHSAVPHLSDKHNLSQNLLDFNRFPKENATITNLSSFYPPKDNVSENGIENLDNKSSHDKLKQLFPNLTGDD